MKETVFFQKITSLHFAPDEEFIYLTFISKNDNLFYAPKNLHVLTPTFDKKAIGLIKDNDFLWHLHNSVHDKKFEYWELDKFVKNRNAYINKLLKIRMKDYDIADAEYLEGIKEELEKRFTYLSNKLI